MQTTTKTTGSDTKDLNLLSQNPLDLKDLNHIAVVDEEYLFLGDDGFACLYDPEKDEYLWKTKMEKYSNAHLSFQYKDKIILVANGDRLEILDKATGKREVSIKVTMHSKPIILDDAFYFMRAGNLVKIPLNDPKEKIKMSFSLGGDSRVKGGQANSVYQELFFYEDRFWALFHEEESGSFLEGVDIHRKTLNKKISIDRSIPKFMTPILIGNDIYGMTETHILKINRESGKVLNEFPLFPKLTKKEWEKDASFRSFGMHLFDNKLHFVVNRLNQSNYLGCLDLQEKQPEIKVLFDERAYSSHYNWAFSYPLLGSFYFISGPKALYGISHGNVLRYKEGQMQSIRIDESDYKVCNGLEAKPAALALLKKKLYAIYNYQNRKGNYSSGLLCFG